MKIFGLTCNSILTLADSLAIMHVKRVWMMVKWNWTGTIYVSIPFISMHCPCSPDVLPLLGLEKMLLCFSLLIVVGAQWLLRRCSDMFSSLWRLNTRLLPQLKLVHSQTCIHSLSFGPPTSLIRASRAHWIFNTAMQLWIMLIQCLQHLNEMCGLLDRLFQKYRRSWTKVMTRSTWQEFEYHPQLCVQVPSLTKEARQILIQSWEWITDVQVRLSPCYKQVTSQAKWHHTPCSLWLACSCFLVLVRFSHGG